MICHLQKNFLSRALNTGGDVGVSLILVSNAIVPLRMITPGMSNEREEVGIRPPRSPKQIGKPRAKTVLGRLVKREVIHVQTEAAVGVHVNELVDLVEIARLAIRSHTHYFVLALIHFEAQKGRERRIKQTERIRKVNLLEQFDPIFATALPISFSATKRRRRPFPDAIDRHDRRLVKWRAEERAGRVRKVMLAEENSILREAELLQNAPFDPELFVEPGDHRFAENARSFRIRTQHRHQNPLELYQRLLMKNDIIKIPGLDACFFQTEIDRQLRKVVIVLLATEALFLGRVDQFAIAKRRPRGVM